MLHALFLLAALAAPHEKIFGDWAVACDNVARCEATALQAPEQSGETPSQMLLTREPGTGALAIAIDPADPIAGPVTLFVKGKPVAAGTIADAYRARGGDAEALAKAMALAGGGWLELRSGAKRIARVSLAGFVEMSRYIAAEQVRTGARALPIVAALRPATAAPETPTRGQLGALAKRADCDAAAVPGDLPVERYRLDARATLVLIPCGAGAYNFNTAAFILRSGQDAPAEFDVPPGWRDGDAPAILTNASFSTSDGDAVLASSAKGRGIGDCGTAQRWVWDGSRFRMIEARVLEACRGSINWLTVFRATPAWR